MLIAAKDAELQTVITTFEVSPGTCADLIGALSTAYDAVIGHRPGFVAAALHVNDAQTRVCAYSQWHRREDFMDMLKTPEMRAQNRQIGALCRSFEPVMYEVAARFG